MKKLRASISVLLIVSLVINTISSSVYATSNSIPTAEPALTMETDAGTIEVYLFHDDLGEYLVEYQNGELVGTTRAYSDYVEIEYENGMTEIIPVTPNITTSNAVTPASIFTCRVNYEAASGVGTQYLWIDLFYDPGVIEYNSSYRIGEDILTIAGWVAVIGSALNISAVIGLQVVQALVANSIFQVVTNSAGIVSYFADTFFPLLAATKTTYQLTAQASTTVTKRFTTARYVISCDSPQYAGDIFDEGYSPGRVYSMDMARELYTEFFTYSYYVVTGWSR